jgi:mannose-6-phosphate isomerase-like protein (cupin superfamily)
MRLKFGRSDGFRRVAQGGFMGNYDPCKSIENYKIITDKSLRESVPYENNLFPLGVWTDYYETYMNKTINCHWHGDFEFGVILSGEVDLYISDTYVKLRGGDGFFINSNMLHTSSQPNKCQNVKAFTVLFSSALFDTSRLIYSKYFAPLLKMRLEGFKFPKKAELLKF